jgi:hypothetical protein
MEIEFNTNKLSKAEPAQPVSRQEAVRRVTEDTFQQTHALEARLKELPVVRPEKVEQAKTLVTDVQYPPDQVLRSLANLLAMKLQ